MIVISLVSLCFQIATMQSFSSENAGLKGQQELKERGGLNNFFVKTIRGDSLKVAYLGGSITAQNGWRVYSLDWFKQRFPKATFTEINAAIPGTGSDFGVFRLKDQVLKFNPDLVFVEFAVNDDGMPSEKVARSMEGIVRQVWRLNPNVDICFVYTIKNDYLETEENGQLPVSAVTMEKVADKYHIPTINFGFEVAAQVKSGNLLFKGESKELNGTKVFSPDGVHPYIETGHAVYSQVLQRSFEKMIPGKIGHIKAHNLKKPMAADCFANSQMVDLSGTKPGKNWKIRSVKENPLFAGSSKYLDQIGEACPGAALSFRFKGTAVGVCDIIGPGAGRVEITLDGEVKDTICRFDAYCTYWRTNYFLMDHLQDKEHEVIFRVLPEPFDKAAILKKRNQTITEPENYKAINWYVGKILIDGEMRTTTDGVSQCLTLEWKSDSVFLKPESAVFDRKQEAIYVSNINGKYCTKDGNGFISKVELDGTIRSLAWINGLDSPQGLTLFNDNLYIADVDQVIVANAKTGVVIRRLQAEGAIFLNDISADKNGDVYVSDCRANRIYRLRNNKLEIWLNDPKLKGPNGLLCQPKKIMVLNMGDNKIYQVDKKTKILNEFCDEIKNLDGIVSDGNGGYFVSGAWQGEIFHLDFQGKKELILDLGPEKVITADITYISKKQMLIVPTLEKTVIAYKWGK